MHSLPRSLGYAWSARACLCLLLVTLTACGPEKSTVATRASTASADDLATQYREEMVKGHAYVRLCKEPPPASITCDDRLAAQITVASDRAWTSIEAAQTAEHNRAPTAGTAKANAQRQLDYLREYTHKIPNGQRRPKPAL